MFNFFKRKAKKTVNNVDDKVIDEKKLEYFMTLLDYDNYDQWYDITITECGNLYHEFSQSEKEKIFSLFDNKSLLWQIHLIEVMGDGKASLTPSELQFVLRMSTTQCFELFEACIQTLTDNAVNLSKENINYLIKRMDQITQMGETSELDKEYFEHVKEKYLKIESEM